WNAGDLHAETVQRIDRGDVEDRDALGTFSNLNRPCRSLDLHRAGSRCEGREGSGKKDGGSATHQLATLQFSGPSSSRKAKRRRWDSITCCVCARCASSGDSILM